MGGLGRSSLAAVGGDCRAGRGRSWCAARSRSLACLASQYAGWASAHEAKRRTSSRSAPGPARALAGASRSLRTSATATTPTAPCWCIEIGCGRRLPADRREGRAATAASRPTASPSSIAPTQSLAGSVQIVARVARGGAAQGARAELPARAHRRRGMGARRSPRRIPTSSTGMGRTNDAIIYRRPGAALRDAARRTRQKRSPRACRARPRATTARRSPRSSQRFGGDFYAIDPHAVQPGARCW